MATREEKIQDILNYIRFNMSGIEKAIRENEDIFEEDSGENIFEEDRNNWNEDYIAKNIVWLRKNFSKKRLNHLIEVRDYIRGPIKEYEEIRVENKNSTYSNINKEKIKNNKSQNYYDSKVKRTKYYDEPVNFKTVVFGVAGVGIVVYLVSKIFR